MIDKMIISLLIVFFIASCIKSPDIPKKNLTNFVTKQGGTEPSFKNAYWDEHRPGIYTDVNTDKPLFSSLDKYDSGTGWPSFTRPIDESLIQKKEDDSLGISRTEVRTNESHLGHVFDDGPDGGQRFCINSAALDFIPFADLERRGYGKYKSLFPYKEAIFAGGCFWGVEELFQEQKGVLDVVSGYTGGNTSDPTYEEVSSGKTGHAESVLVVYDPRIISYESLLDVFWRLHDPTQENRQGPDIGSQYRSAIFYLDEEQKDAAEKSKLELDKSGEFKKPAMTRIDKAKEFYPAEDYYQDYVKNHPSYACHTLRE